MPSIAYRRWATTRARALDEIVQAHTAVGGAGPGRRYTTQQLNQAYAVLLASQFQGFCRDLHTECVGHLIKVLAPPSALRSLVEAELTRGRQLDRGNAQPATLKADFDRFRFDFWGAVESQDPRNARRKAMLEVLNNWRNAVAHQAFDPARLGGSVVLHLARVRRWRTACHHLARSFDVVMGHQLQTLTGVAPW